MSARDPIDLELLPLTGDTFLGWTRGQVLQAADRLLQARPEGLPRDESAEQRLTELIRQYEERFLGGPPALAAPVSAQAVEWVNRTWWAAARESMYGIYGRVVAA